LAVLLLAAGPAAGQDRDKDPVQAKIDKALAAFEAETGKLEKAVADHLQKAEAAARKAGNKTLTDQVKADRAALDLANVVPRALPAGLKQRVAAARAPVEAAYAAAVRDYTRAGKDARAAAVQKELDAFKSSPALAPKYYHVVNTGSGKRVTPAKGSTDRGAALAQTRTADTPIGQWALIPTGTAGAYQVRNRQTGLVVSTGGGRNPGHVPNVGSDTGTETHWEVTRDGDHYSFRAVAADLFLAVRAGGTDEGVELILWTKTGRDDQRFQLVPVKPAE
jgi:hypothetical protein